MSSDPGQVVSDISEDRECSTVASSSSRQSPARHSQDSPATLTVPCCQRSPRVPLTHPSIVLPHSPCTHLTCSQWHDVLYTKTSVEKHLIMIMSYEQRRHLILTFLSQSWLETTLTLAFLSTLDQSSSWPILPQPETMPWYPVTWVS